MLIHLNCYVNRMKLSWILDDSNKYEFNILNEDQLKNTDIQFDGACTRSIHVQQRMNDIQMHQTAWIAAVWYKIKWAIWNDDSRLWKRVDCHERFMLAYKPKHSHHNCIGYRIAHHVCMCSAPITIHLCHIIRGIQIQLPKHVCESVKLNQFSCCSSDLIMFKSEHKTYHCIASTCSSIQW